MLQAHSSPSSGAGLSYRSPRVMLEVVGRTVVFVHAKQDADDADFQGMLAIYRELGPSLSTCRTLVISDGGAPTREQRKQVVASFGSFLKGAPIVMMSDAVAMRFAMSTLSLLAPSMKVVSPVELDPACEFLRLSTSETGELRARLRAMAAATPAGTFRTFDRMAEHQALRRLFA